MDIRYYDGAGRVVQSGPGAGLPSGYIARLNEGVPAGESVGTETRINRFDANGQMLYQRVLKNRSDGLLTAKHNIDYRKADGTGNYDLAGNLLGYKHQNIDGGSYTNTYTHTWARYEGYKQGTTAGTSTQFNPGSVAYQYDANGHLVGITDSRMAANNRTYVNDAQGRILTSTYTQSANVQRQLIANGEVLGRHGVGIDPLKPRNSNGTPRFAAMADFNFGYQPLRGNQIAASGGQHTVAAGDTLEMIARGAYGDGQLWYRIAEANGLTGNTDLVVGQTLVVPNNVATQANNSDTWRPYNAAEMIGDTTPHLPVPKDSCGPMGQVLMIVVAVVVTIYTAGAAAGVMAQAGSVAAATAASGAAGTMAVGAGVLAGGGAVTAGLTTGAMIGAAAIGGAVGSIASQLVGNAIGAVDGFSWKGVALGALGAGVSAGLGNALGVAGQGLEGGARAAAVAQRVATANAISQGIAVATGLQRQFSWTAVAASAVGAGVGSSVNGAVAGSFGDTFGGRLATGMVSGVAAGVATSLMRGGKIATVQVMADAFGNALGNSIVETTIAGARLEEDRLGQFINEQLRAQANRERNQTAQAFFDALHGYMSEPQERPAGEGVLVADASGRLRLSPGSPDAEGGPVMDARILQQREQRDTLARLQRQNSELEAFANQVATERGLRQLEAMADAYRDSDMGGIAGDPYAPDASEPPTRVTIGPDGTVHVITQGPAQQPPNLTPGQRFEAHAQGFGDAARGIVEGGLNSYGITGTPESRAQWAQQTSRAIIDGAAELFKQGPITAIRNWWGDFNSNDPEAVRRATSQVAGATAGILGARAVNKVGGPARNAATGPSATLANVEGRFSGASREVGVIIDSQSGSILGVRRAGLAEGAEIRLNANRDYPLMRGNIFTHNHPKGGAFSPADVATALGAGVAEFRASTPSRTFALKFNDPPSGLLGDRVEAVLFIQREQGAIGASYRAGVANGSLSPPTDLAARKVWASEYFMGQLVERNPWISYKAIQNP